MPAFGALKRSGHRSRSAYAPSTDRACCARALEIVLAQTFTDWRLVIVNNGGDPAPVEAMVTEFETELAGRCTVIHEPTPVEIATACNRCFEGSKCDYFLVHDDDDTLDPTFLERTVAELRALGPVYGGVAVHCDHIDEVIEEDGSIREVGRGVHNPNMLSISFESTLVANPCPPICLLVTREAFEAVGGYEMTQDHASDWMFLLQVLTKYRVGVIPEVLAHYHHRSGVNDAYANAVSNAAQIARGDAQLRDHFVGRALREGELTESQVALSVSEADREIHAAVRRVDRSRQRTSTDGRRHRQPPQARPRLLREARCDPAPDRQVALTVCTRSQGRGQIRQLKDAPGSSDWPHGLPVTLIALAPRIAPTFSASGATDQIGSNSRCPPN